MSEASFNAIAAGLAAHRITVSQIGTSFNLSRGVGLQAHKCNVEMEPWMGALESSDDAQAWVSGFSRGVLSVLAEPRRSNALTWPFERAAGRLMPTLEGPSFAQGVAAASHEEAFVWSPAVGMDIAYVMELDRGYRALTKGQVSAWNVSEDRVKSAARSLLFHRTQELRWTVGEDGVHSLNSGDGYDAARFLVFEDVYFTSLSHPPAVAMPSHGTFLFVPQQNDATLDALNRAAVASFENAEYPLSQMLYGFKGGKLTPLT